MGGRDVVDDVRGRLNSMERFPSMGLDGTR
jgi:hypothetical protein